MDASAPPTAGLRAVRTGMLAGQPAGVFVGRHREPSGLVVGEVGLPVCRARLVRQSDGPAPLAAAPGVPIDRVGVDAARQQPIAHHRAQAAVRHGVTGPAHRIALGEPGDVFPLGDHRSRERLDLRHGNPGRLRHRFERLPGPDPGLDVARPQCTFHLDLQLSHACSVVAQRRSQFVVGRNRQLLAVNDDDQAPAVGAEPQGPGGAHRSIALLCSLWRNLPGRTPHGPPGNTAGASCG